MIKFISIFIFIAILFLSTDTRPSAADVSDSQKPEVKHLLEFVETSDCIFERNGKKYDAADGYKHMKRKYWYYRNKITTTEEFIEYSGTKSTRSGKDYLIYCDNNEPIKSSAWLLEELTRYRNKSI
ncbi:MAG: hypothetical protein DHS20C13_11580 [Thermodesulfobacteriota bacterium]|nr:MAG: hypothetical protein DHS20C13_11580 [Thermodesulfobacteriota bacterium]